MLARAKTVMPSMVVVWADGGYAGKLVAWVDMPAASHWISFGNPTSSVGLLSVRTTG